ncbi:hypothetical protein Val02_44720 [Virgisporangium aliadipatigenens]|uniref:Histidine kinase/HSP90-like ATPase domain-containing protein n=1 Tax=Virgisporangium aliadipatigenens TaxID=741659 RepID=A0A8J3YPK4_9ACTN|nr:ATP-binding protein [Virgisporangium aliadipatigenens]GIJ47586.1 hypothetical protein Val02_44720 [Virgisporangium aliadipatigenens]
MHLSLSLPRETGSVPVARKVLGATLNTVGITEECRADILLALAEACANAVRHAQPADSYEVAVDLDDAMCQIAVIDEGNGFDPATQRPLGSALDETGRGLRIIEALSDQFDLLRNEPKGTTLRFAKRLERSPSRTSR